VRLLDTLPRSYLLGAAWTTNQNDLAHWNKLVSVQSGPRESASPQQVSNSRPSIVATDCNTTATPALRCPQIVPKKIRSLRGRETKAAASHLTAATFIERGRRDSNPQPPDRQCGGRALIGRSESSPAHFSPADGAHVVEGVGHRDTRMVELYRHLRAHDSKLKLQHFDFLGDQADSNCSIGAESVGNPIVLRQSTK
jgi:hypothetical protein